MVPVLLHEFQGRLSCLLRPFDQAVPHGLAHNAPEFQKQGVFFGCLTDITGLRRLKPILERQTCFGCFFSDKQNRKKHDQVELLYEFRLALCLAEPPDFIPQPPAHFGQIFFRKRGIKSLLISALHDFFKKPPLTLGRRGKKRRRFLSGLAQQMLSEKHRGITRRHNPGECFNPQARLVIHKVFGFVKINLPV